MQLHGGNQSHASWLRYSRLAQEVAELPLIAVLPDGAQTRWANGGKPFEAYEDFLVASSPTTCSMTAAASTPFLRSGAFLITTPSTLAGTIGRTGMPICPRRWHSTAMCIRSAPRQRRQLATIDRGAIIDL